MLHDLFPLYTKLKKVTGVLLVISLIHIGTRRTQSAYGDRVARSACSTSRDVV